MKRAPSLITAAILIGLSATKDVQDAILADPTRGAAVSVIEMKYWWYASDGSAYAPEGGKSLAPRQQMREWKGAKSRSAEQTARQIREYRDKFPGKAILCAHDGADPRVEHGDALQRGINARVEEDVGGAEEGGGGVDAVVQRGGADDAARDGEDGRAAGADELAHEGPVARAGHLRVELGFHQHVECVRGRAAQRCSGGEEEEGQRGQARGAGRGGAEQLEDWQHRPAR